MNVCVRVAEEGTPWVVDIHEKEPPMPRRATIKSLPAAFRMMKSRKPKASNGARTIAARDAFAVVLEGRMAKRIDDHLEAMAGRAIADRRNGG